MLSFEVGSHYVVWYSVDQAALKFAVILQPLIPNPIITARLSQKTKTKTTHKTGKPGAFFLLHQIISQD